MEYAVGVILLCLLHTTMSCHYGNVYESPSSQTVEFGESEKFKCVFYGLYIHWYVNGVNTLDMSGQQKLERGISICEAKDDLFWSCLKTGVLSLHGNCLNNNAEIYCVAFGEGNDTSNNATLTVTQGNQTLNESVIEISNMSATQTGSGTLFITWRIQTDTEYLNYTLSLTVDSHNTTHTVQLNQNDLYYIYSTTGTTTGTAIGQCTNYSVTITAQTTTCTGTHSYNKSIEAILAGLPVTAVDIKANKTSLDTTDISFKIASSSTCPGSAPSTLEILLLDTSNEANSSQVQSTGTLPLEDMATTDDDTRYQTTASFEMNTNTEYQILIVSHAIGGSSYSDSVTISTYDVEDVSLTHNNSHLCVQCLFRTEHQMPPTGCFTILTNINTMETQSMVASLDSSKETLSSSTACAYLPNKGNYSLTVYDWEHNGDISNGPALQGIIFNKEIAESISMTTSVSTIPSQTSYTTEIQSSTTEIQSSATLQLSNTTAQYPIHTSTTTNSSHPLATEIPTTSITIATNAKTNNSLVLGVVGSVSGTIILALLVAVGAITALIIRTAKQRRKTKDIDANQYESNKLKEDVTTLQMNSAYDAVKFSGNESSGQITMGFTNMYSYYENEALFTDASQGDQTEEPPSLYERIART